MPDIDLADLEARLAEDLDRLCFNGKDWVPPRHADGKRIRDVVVIGAGMCGLVASVAMQRHGIGNHILYDMAPAGQEGPWITIARMETLRSPKQLTGPAYGLPSLTFRAWFEAVHGTAAWAALDKIDRSDWMAYLVWYRRVMRVPVVNGARMKGMAPAGDGLIAVELDIDGGHERVLTRRLILATGRDGLGGNALPAIAERISSRFRAHSADEIDFAALAGRRVGVIGAGASAMDNAATALEAGAAKVDLFIRRAKMPQVNKGMGVGSPGLTHGYQALPDDWKWRFQAHLNATQTPAPRPSVLRVSKHPNAAFHLAASILDLRETGDGIELTTPQGVYRLDFLIFATGFAVDPARRPELAAIAPHIKLWHDGSAPEGEDPGLAASPVLGEHFEMIEKTPGACPMLKHILCFNFPATLAHGKLSSDIPAISEGADRLARGLCRSFFVEDIEAHWQRLVEYDTPELLGDEWTDADG